MVVNETSTSKTKFEYNADYAQMKAEYEITANGAQQKLGKDMAQAEKIRDLMVDKKYSPYAIIQTFKNIS